MAMLAGINLSKTGMDLSNAGMNPSERGEKHHHHVIIDCTTGEARNAIQ